MISLLSKITTVIAFAYRCNSNINKWQTYKLAKLYALRSEENII